MGSRSETTGSTSHLRPRPTDPIPSRSTAGAPTARRRCRSGCVGSAASIPGRRIPQGRPTRDHGRRHEPAPRAALRRRSRRGQRGRTARRTGTAASSSRRSSTRNWPPTDSSRRPQRWTSSSTISASGFRNPRGRRCIGRARRFGSTSSGDPRGSSVRPAARPGQSNVIAVGRRSRRGSTSPRTSASAGTPSATPRRWSVSIADSTSRTSRRCASCRSDLTDTHLYVYTYT